MKVKLLLLILSVPIVIFSQTRKITINDGDLGKTVNLFSFQNKKNKIQELNRNTKILVSIDSDYKNKLNMWREFIKQTDTSQVGLVFLFKKDFEDSNEYLSNFKYPYFFEKDNINKFSIKGCKTFLLNKANQVIDVWNSVSKENFDEIKNSIQNMKVRKTNIGFNVSFRDEHGNMLSNEQVRKMMQSNQYKQTIDHKTNIITLIRKKD